MARIYIVCLALLLSGLGVSSGWAAISVITDEPSWQVLVQNRNEASFDDFVGPVTTQYPWATFSPFNGGSPNSIAQFPHSVPNSVFTASRPSGGGGGWAADLNGPRTGVAFWTGDVQWPGTTVTLRDSQGHSLGTYDIFVDGGGNGPTLYGFIGFVSDAVPIARVEVSIDPLDAVWFDDVQAGDLNPASVQDLPFTRQSWGELKSLYK